MRSTVAYMGWAGVENGELLRRASAAGFDALVTKDANLRYQQNLASTPLAVVILSAASNHVDDIRPLLPTLLAALINLPPRQVTVVP